MFDTDRLPQGTTVPEVLHAAEICGFAGLNVTYPYKIAVIDYLDELSPAARAVGAVNTIVLRDGKRSGHNTDLWGFAESFRRNMADVERRNVLLVGAGGAGAAVAHALIECGVEVLHIFDNERDKAGALADQVCAGTGKGKAVALSGLDETGGTDLDGVVNATPVGMEFLPGMPIPEQMLQPRLWVADIIYFPLETELLRRARQAGCRVLPGSGMAIFQAARAFEHFTGLKSDMRRMEATFNAFEPMPQGEARK